MFGFIGDAISGIGDALTGGAASSYAPVPVKLGAAPQVSEQAGAQAIQQQAAIQQGQVQRQALGMASGTGSEASRLGAIAAGGQAAAGIGAQAVQARQALYQQIQQANAGMIQQRDISRAGLETGAAESAQNLTAQSREAKVAAKGELVKGVMESAGTAAMMSDERMKTGVRPASRRDIGQALHEATDEFGGVEPVSYRYKDDTGLPTDRRIGVMAQDMEHTGTVSEDEGGHKQIDMAKALSLALAAAADLHDRVDQLENRKGKRGKRG